MGDGLVGSAFSVNGGLDVGDPHFFYLWEELVGEIEGGK